MDTWERIKQILDAISYFGGLCTGISIIAGTLLLVWAIFFTKHYEKDPNSVFHKDFYDEFE